MVTKSNIFRTCLLIFLIIASIGFLWPPQAEAFSLPEIFGKAKDKIVDLITPDPSQQLTIDSKIELAKDGDLNGNGQIDSGDTIIFTYTITNSTDQELPFNTLKTNIPRGDLHFIHHVYGTASLSDKNNTIEIPNLRINPQQDLVISFKAKVNYSQQDPIIWTQPELVSQDKKSLFQAKREEIKAKAWKEKQLPANVMNSQK